MKIKNVIKSVLAAGLLLAAVTGCAKMGTVSNNMDPGSDYSTGGLESSSGSSDTGSSESSSLPKSSEPPENEYVPKFYETAINSDGIVIVNSNQMRGLSLSKMDNNYVYLSSNSIPRTVFSLDRSDYSSFGEVMTFRFDVEFAVFNNKRTYCGWYFAFPCYGNPYDGNGFTMRVYAGTTGEQMKCIFDKKAGSLSACAAELNETEMVFLRYSDDNDAAEIYKYKVGYEQAQLIYTEVLSDYSLSSCPLIACFNEQIFFIYSINDSQVLIKTLSPDGKEVKSETVELPNNYAAMKIHEFTVAENNYVILFDPGDEDIRYKQVLINRKNKRVFADFGEKGFGSRYNDSIIDDRYIIFLKNKGQDPYSYPILSIFDDKTLEFHFLKFRALSDVEVTSSAVDYKGDIIFTIRDENGDKSLVLYEDITSLI